MRTCLTLLLLFAAPLTLNAQTPQPTWEYGTLTTIDGVRPFVWTIADSSHMLATPGTTETATYVKFVTYLNQLGRDHWELVLSQPQASGTMLYVFKRRKT